MRRFFRNGLSMGLLLLFNTAAEAQSVNWLKQMGYNRTRGTFSKVVVDKDANIIQNFQSDYYQPVIGTDSIRTKHMNAVVVAKYDSLGNYKWSQAITGPTWGTYAGGIATDKSGNIYATGWTFSDTIYYSPTNSQPTGYLNGASGYLVKYSPAGQVIWRKLFPAGADSLNCQPYSVMVDNDDHVIVGGKFFWNTSLGDTVIRGSFCNMLLMKFTPAGNREWVRVGKGNTGFNWWSSLACDSSNNIYATGKKGGEINFGGGYIIPLDSSLERLVVAKFSSLGVPQWHLTRKGKISPGFFPNTQNNFGASIATDKMGHVYVTGSLVDSFSANPNASWGYDYHTRIFMAKLGSDGTVVWEITPKAGVDGQGREIIVDKCGHPYMTASYNGALTLGTTMLPATNTSQAYVAKLDSASGNPIWVTNSTGSETHADGLAINPISGTLINAANYRADVAWGTKIATFTPYVSSLHRNYLIGSIANIVDCPPKQGPSSVPEISNSAVATVFPNPALGSLFVKAKENGISLKLMDIAGKVIYSTTTTSNLTSIDISQLRAGVYTVHLAAKDGQTQVLKVVVGL